MFLLLYIIIIIIIIIITIIIIIIIVVVVAVSFVYAEVHTTEYWSPRFNVSYPQVHYSNAVPSEQLVLVTVIKMRHDTHDTLKEHWSDEGMTFTFVRRSSDTYP
jgi:hypothetical protein